MVAKSMKSTFLAYLDLLRVHFLVVWPILGCSGLFLAFQNYGGFDAVLLLKVIVVAIFSFEGGMILNDYIDREIDRKDVEQRGLTAYWRPFGTRPLAQGLISPVTALTLFVLFTGISILLILTIEPPHSYVLLGFLSYSYVVESFYQVKKRHQTYPIAQLIGRTDLALFPVAGYLSYGNLDIPAILYFVFLYLWAQAHLGVNDLADVRNDRARGLQTIPILYGMGGGIYWVVVFSGLHLLVVPLFLWSLGTPAIVASIVAAFLIGAANVIILRERSAAAALRALPLFHASLLVYAISIILSFFV